MKAVRFHEYGDPDVLRYEDIEIPTPGPAELRLRVAASAFNPVDDGIRGGDLRDVFPVTLPHTPGIDIAGTVDALGEGVTGSQIGDDVIGFLPIVADGGAAEFVVAPAEALAPAPTSVPLADAAALPMVDLTAWQALFDDAGLTAGRDPHLRVGRHRRPRLKQPILEAEGRSRSAGEAACRASQQ